MLGHSHLHFQAVKSTRIYYLTRNYGLFLICIFFNKIIVYCIPSGQKLMLLKNFLTVFIFYLKKSIIGYNMPLRRSSELAVQYIKGCGFGSYQELFFDFPSIMGECTNGLMITFRK